MEDNLIFTVEEVSKILKVEKATVRKLIEKGILVGLKLGRMKVTKVEVLRFLQDNTGKDLTDLDNIKFL